jgi:protein TonB
MKNIRILFLAGVLFAISCDSPKSHYASQETTECWDEDSVFPMQVDADQYASFKEGDEALLKFLSSETKYPVQARENNEEGKVFVRFVVKKDGSVTDVEVIRGASKSLDREAVRLARLTSGKWNPGVKNGKEVNVYMTLPVYFKLK